MHRVDAWRMIQRRSSELGMKVKISCHTFRAGLADCDLNALARRMAKAMIKVEQTGSQA
jgi:hypothetical protein